MACARHMLLSTRPDPKYLVMWVPHTYMGMWAHVLTHTRTHTHTHARTHTTTHRRPSRSHWHTHAHTHNHTQEAKQVALGPEHDVSLLPSVLADPLLGETWRKAASFREQGWFMRYKLHRMKVGAAAGLTAHRANQLLQSMPELEAQGKAASACAPVFPKAACPCGCSSISAGPHR